MSNGARRVVGGVALGISGLIAGQCQPRWDQGAQTDGTKIDRGLAIGLR